MNSLPYYMIHCAAFGLVVNFAAAQTVYTVGESMGWTIPPNASLSYYSNWASGKTFKVGDTLVFNFTTGKHDVVQVPKASYDGCNDNVTLGDRLTVGPVNVALDSVGDRYYICNFGTHCELGQKLLITVFASSTPAAASPPPTTPTTPLPATPPPTTPTASSPPPTTTTAPPPPSPITSTTPSPATPRPPPPPMSASSVSLGGSFFIITMCVALALII